MNESIFEFERTHLHLPLLASTRVYYTHLHFILFVTFRFYSAPLTSTCIQSPPHVYAGFQALLYTCSISSQLPSALFSLLVKISFLFGGLIMQISQEIIYDICSGLDAAADVLAKTDCSAGLKGCKRCTEERQVYRVESARLTSQ